MDATVQKTADITWKLSYGNSEQVQHGEIFQNNCVRGKQPTIDLTVGPSKDYGRNFFKLRGILDTEWVFLDGSHIRAHQHASGA